MEKRKKKRKKRAEPTKETADGRRSADKHGKHGKHDKRHPSWLPQAAGTSAHLPPPTSPPDLLSLVLPFSSLLFSSTLLSSLPPSSVCPSISHRSVLSHTFACLISAPSNVSLMRSNSWNSADSANARCCAVFVQPLNSTNSSFVAPSAVIS